MPMQSPPPGQSKVKRKVSKRHAASPPSLLEIQQIRAGQHEPDSRRDDWLSSQHRSSHGDLVSRGRDGGGASPDEGWSLVNGHEAASHGTNIPPSQQNNLYLPPGARPPSPARQRSNSGTPSRNHYPSSVTHSQSSIQNHNAQNGYNDIDPYAQSAPRVNGRERGYSSASGSLRSDHESSGQSHGHHTGYLQNINMMPVPKPAPPVSARSPLINAYNTGQLAGSPPPNSTTYGQYGQHPFGTTSPGQAQPQLLAQAQPQPPYPPLVSEMHQMKLERPEDQQEEPVKDKEGKEKKRFWGRIGGDKKDKKNKEATSDWTVTTDQSRPSGDWGRESETASMPPSSHGHGIVLNEEETRYKAPALGLEVGQRMPNPSQVDNVTAAIQILCAHPDPAFGSIYEICDRLNHSSSAEQVGKEAAQALRKQFKHGNEQERRAAANLWLIMMRNVHSKGFRCECRSEHGIISKPSPRYQQKVPRGARTHPTRSCLQTPRIARHAPLDIGYSRRHHLPLQR